MATNELCQCGHERFDHNEFDEPYRCRLCDCAPYTRFTRPDKPDARGDWESALERLYGDIAFPQEKHFFKEGWNARAELDAKDAVADFKARLLTKLDQFEKANDEEAKYHATHLINCGFVLNAVRKIVEEL